MYSVSLVPCPLGLQKYKLLCTGLPVQFAGQCGRSSLAVNLSWRIQKDMRWSAMLRTAFLSIPGCFGRTCRWFWFCCWLPHPYTVYHLLSVVCVAEEDALYLLYLPVMLFHIYQTWVSTSSISLCEWRQGPLDLRELITQETLIKVNLNNKDDFSQRRLRSPQFPKSKLTSDLIAKWRALKASRNSEDVRTYRSLWP